MPGPRRTQDKRYNTRSKDRFSGIKNGTPDTSQETSRDNSSPKRKRKKYRGRSGRSGPSSSRGSDRRPQHDSYCELRNDTAGSSWRTSRRNDRNETQQGSTSGGDELDIPGFYYDKEKKRYFKIAPNHSVSNVTRDAISKKEAEIKRKKDEESLLSTSTIKDSQKTSSKRINLAFVLRDRTCVNQSLQILKDSFLISNITQLKPTSSQLLFKTGRHDSYCYLEHMQQMFLSKSHDEVLGLWSLKETWVQRIQLIEMSEKTRTSSTSCLSVSVKPYHKVILQSLNKVTDLCWAPMPGQQDKKIILYTTICHTGYLHSLAMIRCLNADQDNSESPHHQDYNLGKKATWTCAWNYHRQQFSIGSEKCALMMNIERRTMWDFNTNNSDPLSQTFSHQTGNFFHTGTRKGQILTFDLRSRSSYPISTLVHKSSVGSLSLLQDDVSLLASDFSGRVCLWDLRKRRTVVEYSGNINQYTKLPVHVDESEHAVYTVGEDGYTRFWNLKQGTLLHTIPPPLPVSRGTIPSVQYSMRWGNRQGNAGLIMGLENKLHFYGNLHV